MTYTFVAVLPLNCDSKTYATKSMIKNVAITFQTAAGSAGSMNGCTRMGAENWPRNIAVVTRPTPKPRRFAETIESIQLL